MKKLVLGIGLCSSVWASACPFNRCLVGIVALVGLTLAGCTSDNTPPPPGPYYAPPTGSSSYSSSYESHSQTINGETRSTFSGEVTRDGKTTKYKDRAAYERDNPEPRFDGPTER